MLPLLPLLLMVSTPPIPLWPSGKPDGSSRPDAEETVHQPGESFLTDRLSPRPALTALVYPAYLDTGGKPDLSPDLVVVAGAPPAFVAQTLDDSLALSAFAYTLACRKAGVPAELHIFPKGGHGYGIRTKEPGLAGWMDLLVAWLTRNR